MPKTKLQPGDAGYDWSTYSAADRDQPITNAKNYLATAPDLSNVANIEDRLANLSRKQKEENPADFSNYVPAALDKLAMAGSLSHFIAPGNPIADVSNLWMAGRAAQDIYKGGTTGAREHPISTGLDAAMMLPAIGSLRGLRSAKAIGETAAEIGNPEMVREVVNTARGYKGQGMSTPQAAQHAGWPLGQSTEAPYPMGSEIPAGMSAESPSFTGLSAAARDRQAQRILGEHPGAYGEGGLIPSGMEPTELRPIDTRPRTATEINDPRPLQEIIDAQRRLPTSPASRAVLDEQTLADVNRRAAERTQAGNLPREPQFPESWQQFAQTPEKRLSKLSKRPSRARKVS